MDLMDLFRPSRKGEVYDGEVRRCTDPLLVRWPGHYGLKADGSIDKKLRVEYDATLDAWRRV